ncbi:MAG: potassium-transporting ATPase subunit KdpC [Candidatus Xenobia bacterium]
MKHLVVALKMTIVLTLLTGLVYPLLMWGLAKLIFPYQAEGSLVHRADGTVAGSSLIGQSFTKPQYFHPRPSAAGNGYDPTSSGGTNLGPTSKKLLEGDHSDPKNVFLGVQDLAAQVRQENNLAPDAPVPVDAVTRSASGLDPDISPEYAQLQVARIARARGMAEETVQKAVEEATHGRDLGFLGEDRVNVLEANLALDRYAGGPK